MTRIGPNEVYDGARFALFGYTVLAYDDQAHCDGVPMNETYAERDLSVGIIDLIDQWGNRNRDIFSDDDLVHIASAALQRVVVAGTMGGGWDAIEHSDSDG